MLQSAPPRLCRSPERHGRLPMAGALMRAPAPQRGLLSGLVFDRRVDLLLHGLQIERGWVLHRREFDGRLCQVRYLFLHHDESPELPGVEIVHVTAAQIVETLLIDGRSALK